MHMYQLLMATFSNSNLHHIPSSRRQHITALSPRRQKLQYEYTKVMIRTTKHTLTYQ